MAKWEPSPRWMFREVPTGTCYCGIDLDQHRYETHEAVESMLVEPKWPRLWAVYSAVASWWFNLWSRPTGEEIPF